MTIDTKEYARLADDAYNDHSKDLKNTVSIGGVDYTILAVASNSRTGYQGTAYQRKDTGEVVIAHRGTESLLDGAVDGRMIATNLNAQAPDAQAFTERAMQVAKTTETKYGHPITVTTTGHSLGGCLAQIMAYRNGLHGETFNPYFGAASLNMGIPEGGNQIINHARATDVASATGKHFGEMRLYAPTQDIDLLSEGRYLDANPNNNNPLFTVTVDAHKMGNFLPGNAVTGDSILTPENEARAQKYAKSIAEYRQDVMSSRNDLHTVFNSHQSSIPDSLTAKARLGAKVADFTLTSELPSAGEAIGQTYGAVVQGAEIVKEKAEQAIDAADDAVKQGAETVKNKAEQAYSATRDTVVRGAQTLENKAEQAYNAAHNAVVRGAQTMENKVEQAYNAAHDAVVQGAETVKNKAEQVYGATRDAVVQSAQTVERKAEQAYDAVRERLNPSPSDHPAQQQPGQGYAQSRTHYENKTRDVERLLERPPVPKDPFRLPSEAGGPAKAGDQIMRRGDWTRSPETEYWSQPVTVKTSWLFNETNSQYASAAQAERLDKAAEGVIKNNLSNSPQAIAERYRQEYEQNGWSRHGPMPPTVQTALRTPANQLRASDGHTYSQGVDGQWSRPGKLLGVSGANLAVQKELDATLAARQRANIQGQQEASALSSSERGAQQQQTHAADGHERTADAEQRNRSMAPASAAAPGDTDNRDANKLLATQKEERQRLLVMKGQRIFQTEKNGVWTNQKVEEAGALQTGLYNLYIGQAADKKQNYSGVIVHADTDNIYQQVGKGRFVMHSRSDFDQIPEIGSAKSISYDTQNKANVSAAAVNLSHGRSR